MDSADRVSRYHPPRVRLLLLVLTCGFIAAVSYLPTRSTLAALAGLGWLMITLMAVASLVLLARALRPGPSVIVDDRGITDRTVLAPAVLVAWDEITVLRKKEIGRGMGAERLLEIILKPDAPYHSRSHSAPRRLIERYRRLMKLPPLNIPGSMVSVPLAQLIEDIRARRPKLQVLAGPPPAPSKFRWGSPPQRRKQHPELPRW